MPLAAIFPIFPVPNQPVRLARLLSIRIFRKFNLKQIKRHSMKCPWYEENLIEAENMRAKV